VNDAQHSGVVRRIAWLGLIPLALVAGYIGWRLLRPMSAAFDIPLPADGHCPDGMGRVTRLSRDSGSSERCMRILTVSVPPNGICPKGTYRKSTLEGGDVCCADGASCD
jgi:hypothetical protein